MTLYQDEMQNEMVKRIAANVGCQSTMSNVAGKRLVPTGLAEPSPNGMDSPWLSASNEYLRILAVKALAIGPWPGLSVKAFDVES